MDLLAYTLKGQISLEFFLGLIRIIFGVNQNNLIYERYKTITFEIECDWFIVTTCPIIKGCAQQDNSTFFPEM